MISGNDSSHDTLRNGIIRFVSVIIIFSASIFGAINIYVALYEINFGLTIFGYIYLAIPIIVIFIFIKIYKRFSVPSVHSDN